MTLSDWAKTCHLYVRSAMEKIDNGEEVVGHNNKIYTSKDDYIDACILQVATTVANGTLTRDITIVQAFRILGIME